MSPLCLTLAHKDRPLLYSLAAIEEIEQATGRTIVQILGTPGFDVGLQAIVTMAHVGIKHGGEANLTRDRVRTMLDRDFEAGVLSIKDVIETVQRGLVRSATFRSQVPADVLAELDAMDSKERGGVPLVSANGAPESNP